jgi:hypothetical protein
MMSPALAIPAERDTALLSGAGERIGEPGRDDEARSGAACLVKLVRVQHGAGAHDRARDGRHFADHIERRPLCGA